MSEEGTLFDAREAFADQERGGDLLWSETPAQPIPLRPRDGSRSGKRGPRSGGPRPGRDAPPADVTTSPRLTPHADPPTGRVARRARADAARATAPTSKRPARARTDAPAAIVPPARTGGPRRLAEPQPTRVEADDRGRPLAVDGRPVEGIRESWLVEDRWWTDRSLRRRYWEVVTDDGRDLVVFRELGQGGWYRQRG